MSYFLAALKKFTNIAGHRGFYTTFVIAGILGYILGFFFYPTWQEIVEYGQAVINKVPYPQETPFYRIQSSIWSLPAQTAGLILFLGVPEKTLCAIVSGILGMISFQAVSLVVFAISRQALFSIAATVFIFLTRAVEFGVIYPVWVLGYPHTHGILGLALSLFIVALFANRRNKPAMFLLGLMPAIHLSYSLLLWICFGRYIRKAIRSFFLFGLSVALVSFVVHLLVQSRLSVIPSSGSALIMDAFVRYWDAHRRPVPLSSPGTIITFAGMIIGGIVLILHRRFSQEIRFFSKTMFICGILSFLSIILTWLPVDWIPDIVQILMPARWMNLVIISFAPFVLGFLGRGMRMLSLSFLPLVFSILIMVWLVILIYIGGLPSQAQAVHRISNDEVFVKAARLPGIILTGSNVYYVQLRTGRPVLLDAGRLDIFPYAANTGPLVSDILQKIYGIDLLNPPQEIRQLRPGGLLKSSGKILWESRSGIEWNKIGEQFGITAIITWSDWNLQLPNIARSQQYALYQIP